MQAENLLTSQELLERSGIGNQKTLTRWHQRGLIPPPVIRTHPKGRGKVGCWETWVLRRIKEIQDRTAKGETLDQIATDLGQDWDAERKRLKPHHRRDIVATLSHSFERDLARFNAMDNFAEWASQLIFKFLETMGAIRPANAAAMNRSLAASALVTRALELMREGHMPILLVSGRDYRVLPIFLLPSALAHPEATGLPILAVPIQQLLLEAFADVEPNLPKKAKLVPATRVLDRSQKPPRLRRYRHKGPWAFEFEG